MHRGIALVFLAMISNGLASATGMAQHAPAGAASCSGCHGMQPDATLSLAGLSAQEILQAMSEFRSGERQGTIMGRIAAGFSEAELQAITDWLEEREK